MHRVDFTHTNNTITVQYVRRHGWVAEAKGANGRRLRYNDSHKPDAKGLYWRVLGCDSQQAVLGLAAIFGWDKTEVLRAYDAVRDYAPTPKKVDDRDVCDATPYCTTTTGKPCRYEVDGAPGATGIRGTACALFPTTRGPQALRLGREAQSMRCRDCRELASKSMIPAREPQPHDWPHKSSPKVGKTEAQLEQEIRANLPVEQTAKAPTPKCAHGFTAWDGPCAACAAEEAAKAKFVTIPDKETVVDAHFKVQSVQQGCPEGIATAVARHALMRGAYEGAANAMPAPAQETDLAGLADWAGWNEYGMRGVYTEHRQVIDDAISKTAVGAWIVWYWDGTGVAFVSDKKNPVRVFLIGCRHEWKHHSNDGRCLNTYKCAKCGRTQQVDSSD